MEVLPSENGILLNHPNGMNFMGNSLDPNWDLKKYPYRSIP